jgi:hypothetical protein
MRPLIKIGVLAVGLSSFLSAGVSALVADAEPHQFSDEGDLSSAFEKGYTSLDFRLRYEDANQSGSAEQGAQALTLKSRISYQTQRFNFFSAFVQLNSVSALPNDENYNSGGNGQNDDVLVADPKGAGVGQAWLSYDIANTLFKYGRQHASLNNERLLGGNAWRQDEQMYTGISIQNESLNYTRFQFSQFNRVGSAFDNGFVKHLQPLNVRLMNLEYRGFSLNTLSIYNLLIDDAGSQALWETNTYGVYFAGRAGGDFLIDYVFEYAKQKDAGSNVSDYSADYALYEVQLSYSNVGLKLGREKLGADGVGYFVTPLASLHDYQGWSDQLASNGLGNLPGGLIDDYVGLSFSCSENFELSTIYHDFKSDDASFGFGDIGTEWGLKAETVINEFTMVAKYADYRADNYGIDTTRLWLSVGLSF